MSLTWFQIRCLARFFDFLFCVTACFFMGGFVNGIFHFVETSKAEQIHELFVNSAIGFVILAVPGFFVIRKIVRTKRKIKKKIKDKFEEIRAYY